MVEAAASTPTPTVEPLDDRGSAVRFETQCIVIPDLAHRSRRPRVATKSYTLPLWKKRTLPTGPSATAALPVNAFSEENQSHLVLRVPLPTFSLKSHSTTRSADHTPLSPCLVHRAQHSGPSCASTPSLAQHTHTSRKPSSSSRSDIVTVPLRPCCTACESVTEAALVGGEAWQEHFSRAASRRRSVSADGPRTITVAGSAASASYGALGVSITVDEVDKRRRSSDTCPSTSSQGTSSDYAKFREGYRVPPTLRRTPASGSAAVDSCPPSSPIYKSPTTPRIPEEEDDESENELFPLPSPKPTPTTSPVPSPAGSLSSLTVAQASPTPSTCSGNSASLRLTKGNFLEPPRCSSSSLSLPKLSQSTTDLALNEDPSRAPSPNLLSMHLPLSGRRSPSPRVSFVPPTTTSMSSSAADETLPKILQPLVPVPVPAPTTMPSSPGQSHSSASPHHSPIHVRFPWRSKRSVSVDFIPATPSSSTTPSCSPSASPTLSNSLTSKKSFSLTDSRHIIADVLRGVAAMGSSTGIGAGAGM